MYIFAFLVIASFVVFEINQTKVLKKLDDILSYMQYIHEAEEETTEKKGSEEK